MRVRISERTGIVAHTIRFVESEYVPVFPSGNKFRLHDEGEGRPNPSKHHRKRKEAEEQKYILVQT